MLFKLMLILFSYLFIYSEMPYTKLQNVRNTNFYTLIYYKYIITLLLTFYAVLNLFEITKSYLGDDIYNPR